ncbi:MAG: ABC transporter permease [Wenzhouxiangellaceae bacterium]
MKAAVAHSHWRPGLVVALLALAVYSVIALAVAAGWMSNGWTGISGQSWEPASAEHWFGTNQVGQDIFARAMIGTRSAFSIGIVVTLGALLAGAMLGLIAGLHPNRWVDRAVLWLAAVFDSVPFYLLAAAVLFAFGEHPAGLYGAMIAAFWTSHARLLRGEVMRLSQLDFITAARLAGLNRWQVAWRHLLPNSGPVLLIQSTIVFVSAIKTEIVLSFIGLNGQHTVSWGMMLSDSTQELPVGQFNNFLAATLMLSGLILAMNVVNDALQDWLDPRYQSRGASHGAA